MLAVENKSNVIVCAGVSGSGKSTFGLRLIANGDFSFVFCFDPEPGQFNSTLGEFADRLGVEAARDMYELGMALCNGIAIFDPHHVYPGQLAVAFDWFCEWTFDVCSRLPGRKILLVDEVWKYCSPHSIPLSLATIVQTGRKRGLGLLVNTQRPNRLNDAILNEVSEMVCFRLQGDNALDKVAAYGFDQEELKALPDLHLIGRNVASGGELRGAIPI